MNSLEIISWFSSHCLAIWHLPEYLTSDGLSKVSNILFLRRPSYCLGWWPVAVPSSTPLPAPAKENFAGTSEPQMINWGNVSIFQSIFFLFIHTLIELPETE